LDIAALNEAADCEAHDHIELDLDPGEGEDAATVAAPQSVPPPLPKGAEVFLNTATIRESDAPNRDESAYADAAYVQLRANIQQVGRNIAAIKVRRVKRVRNRSMAHVLYEVSMVTAAFGRVRSWG
jgi:hypothetical protein